MAWGTDTKEELLRQVGGLTRGQAKQRIGGYPLERLLQ